MWGSRIHREVVGLTCKGVGFIVKEYDSLVGSTIHMWGSSNHLQGVGLTSEHMRSRIHMRGSRINKWGSKVHMWSRIHYEGVGFTCWGTRINKWGSKIHVGGSRIHMRRSRINIWEERIQGPFHMKPFPGLVILSTFSPWLIQERWVRLRVMSEMCV